MIGALQTPPVALTPVTPTSPSTSNPSETPTPVNPTGASTDPTTATDPTAAVPPTLTPLESYVASRGVTYEAVVLGPVNTGIFATNDGYVVLALGQTLPDSSIVVKDITATSVTLALGSDETILELQKR
ncbi:hypothetical protein DES52_101191 [Deinococcus yavapaiensis KR-236]|uniref:Uncharacterized protein n=1 Tax=Deinococcus yavapaiensis KR-236 TaxID=694435 RepID=A0A318SF10_9DEIO|nr:hypothetical protein DES52_101191 [Deinococcus yavapaiensis KR-236]